MLWAPRTATRTSRRPIRLGTKIPDSESPRRRGILRFEGVQAAEIRLKAVGTGGNKENEKRTEPASRRRIRNRNPLGGLEFLRFRNIGPIPRGGGGAATLLLLQRRRGNGTSGQSHVGGAVLQHFFCCSSATKLRMGWRQWTQNPSAKLATRINQIGGTAG